MSIENEFLKRTEKMGLSPKLLNRRINIHGSYATIIGWKRGRIVCKDKRGQFTPTVNFIRLHASNNNQKLVHGAWK